MRMNLPSQQDMTIGWNNNIISQIMKSIMVSCKYLLTSILIFSVLYGCNSDIETERPNIIWIIADDASSDFGTYGNNTLSTPNIDRLASDGVKFTNVFTTSPDCTPSRTAIAVGMHQGSIGAHHKRYPENLKPSLPEDIKTMNSHLNGYTTANITDEIGTGKVDWAFKADLSAQFEHNHWNELVEQEKPFFAQIDLRNPHRPFSDSAPNEYEDFPILPYYPDHAVVRKDFADYYKSIEQLDYKLGVVLDKLGTLGFKDNTIIFFFSDNGRPFTRGKSSLYDSGIKIPAIIHIPNQLESPEEYQPGTADDRMISSIDFSATSLSLAGIGKPDKMQGRIFWGEDKDSDREYVFSALDRTGGSYFKSRAIRSEKYKYIRNYRHDFSINEMATAYTKQNHPIHHLLNILKEQNKLDQVQSFLVEDLPAEELYDLEEDPYEINNLVNKPEYQNILSELRTKLETHLEAINDQGLQADSDEVRRTFEEYGKESFQQREDDIEQLHQQVLQQTISES